MCKIRLQKSDTRPPDIAGHGGGGGQYGID